MDQKNSGSKVEKGFSRAIQVGIIVRDIEKSIEKYREIMGWEPVGRAETPKGETYYYGEKEDFCVKMAFYQFDNIEIELLEPAWGRSLWQDYLDEHGEGIHHILFDVDNFSGTQARLEKHGIKLAQEGPSARYPGAKWGYFDSTEQLGFILEVFNPSEHGYEIRSADAK